jgi:predicted TIM-barrel fold metal-dependent hydrolase
MSEKIDAGYRIDVHGHYVDEVIIEWMKTASLGPTPGPAITQWSVTGALDFMDRHAIAAQILSVGFDFLRPEEDANVAVRLTRHLNEAYANLIEDHPDRFGAFAAIPLTTSDAALAEIDYALDVLGLDGILLTSNVAGTYIGQPFFEPILAELSRREVPVFIHPAACPHIEVLGLGRPSFLIEFPIDTARAITNAIYRGVFQRHTGLRLILAHAGGALPTLGWRLAENATVARRPDDAHIDAQHVADVLAEMHYETALAASAHSLLPTLQVTGHEHILFGTDYPAAPERAIAHNIANLMTFNGFNETQRRAVERGNATRLFPRLARDATG